MKYLLFAALIALSSCSVHADERQPEYILRLETKEGVCSGTVIKPNVILTAKHCLSDGQMKAVNRDGLKVLDIKEFVTDSTDNALIVLNKNQFKRSAYVSFENKQRQGANVHIVGNVMGLQYMLRRGYMVGTTNDGLADVTLWDMNIWKGDSGSCIFHWGVCVGVVSFFHQTPDNNFKLAGSYNFTFDKDKLKELGL